MISIWNGRPSTRSVIVALSPGAAWGSNSDRRDRSSESMLLKQLNGR
jgi:hypothetical protein